MTKLRTNYKYFLNVLLRELLNPDTTRERLFRILKNRSRWTKKEYHLGMVKRHIDKAKELNITLMVENEERILTALKSLKENNRPGNVQKKEIVKLIEEGRRRQEIIDITGFHPITIRNHIRNLYKSGEIEEEYITVSPKGQVFLRADYEKMYIDTKRLERNESIYRYLMEGLPYKTIMDMLKISKGTIDYAKVDLMRRPHLYPEFDYASLKKSKAAEIESIVLKDMSGRYSTNELAEMHNTTDVNIRKIRHRHSLKGILNRYATSPEEFHRLCREYPDLIKKLCYNYMLEGEIITREAYVESNYHRKRRERLAASLNRYPLLKDCMKATGCDWMTVDEDLPCLAKSFVKYNSVLVTDALFSKEVKELHDTIKTTVVAQSFFLIYKEGYEALDALGLDLEYEVFCYHLRYITTVDERYDYILTFLEEPITPLETLFKSELENVQEDYSQRAKTNKKRVFLGVSLFAEHMADIHRILFELRAMPQFHYSENIVRKAYWELVKYIVKKLPWKQLLK